MKGANLLLISELTALGIIFNLTAEGMAQTAYQDCGFGDRVCEAQQRRRYEQPQKYLKTPLQYHERRVSGIESGCYQNNSSPCRQLDPKLNSALENPTLQELRRRQDDLIERNLR